MTFDRAGPFDPPDAPSAGGRHPGEVADDQQRAVRSPGQIAGQVDPEQVGGLDDEPRRGTLEIERSRDLGVLGLDLEAEDLPRGIVAVEQPGDEMPPAAGRFQDPSVTPADPLERIEDLGDQRGGRLEVAEVLADSRFEVGGVMRIDGVLGRAGVRNFWGGRPSRCWSSRVR